MEKKQVAAQLQDYFQCPICFQKYSQVKRIPRVLMCGHTICQSCIFLIIQKHQNFRCPICKTNLGELRIGLTYKNFSLMHLMEINNLNGKEKDSGQVTYIVSKQTFQQIVNELDKAPKNITKLVVKRLRDEKNNAFDHDLIRSNKHSMRFYKILVKFYKLQHFQLWVKFSAHGFEQCLAETLFELQHLKSVRIVNAYDQYERMRELIPLTANEKIKFDIQIRSWEN